MRQTNRYLIQRHEKETHRKTDGQTGRSEEGATGPSCFMLVKAGTYIWSTEL